jgi:glutamine amidotransferase
MIVVVDSGVANLTSVLAAFSRLGVSAEASSDPLKIAAADRVILPGVGAAEAAMQKLADRGLIETLQGLTKPVLGICLGMQILFKSSVEGREGKEPLPCLGLIDGAIEALASSPDRPVPHMGWNQIAPRVKDSPLLRGLDEGSFVYFVHSFAAPVGDYSLATCTYANEFTAVAQSRNFFGCQFHPERSGAVGRRILENFLSI